MPYIYIIRSWHHRDILLDYSTTRILAVLLNGTSTTTTTSTGHIGYYETLGHTIEIRWQPSTTLGSALSDDNYTTYKYILPTPLQVRASSDTTFIPRSSPCAGDATAHTAERHSLLQKEEQNNNISHQIAK